MNASQQPNQATGIVVEQFGDWHNAKIGTLPLRPLGRGEFLIKGFRNADLRVALYGEEPDPEQRRRTAARVTRQLALLKAHGLIVKVNSTHRYQLSAAGRRIVFTRHGPLLADGSDMVARRRRRDRDSLASTGTPALWHRGTFEHEVVAALAPAPGELVTDKNTSSAFNSTGIGWLLRNMAVETLVVVGMATDMCVETTARDAADRGFDVIVVEDATATFVERHHRAALSGFARVFGQVWATDDVLAALRRL